VHVDDDFMTLGSITENHRSLEEEDEDEAADVGQRIRTTTRTSADTRIAYGWMREDRNEIEYLSGTMDLLNKLSLEHNYALKDLEYRVDEVRECFGFPDEPEEPVCAPENRTFRREAGICVRSRDSQTEPEIGPSKYERIPGTLSLKQCSDECEKLGEQCTAF
jgi:hypothetical protein